VIAVIAACSQLKVLWQFLSCIPTCVCAVSDTSRASLDSAYVLAFSSPAGEIFLLFHPTQPTTSLVTWVGFHLLIKQAIRDRVWQQCWHRHNRHVPRHSAGYHHFHPLIEEAKRYHLQQQCFHWRQRCHVGGGERSFFGTTCARAIVLFPQYFHGWPPTADAPSRWMLAPAVCFLERRPLWQHLSNCNQLGFWRWSKMHILMKLGAVRVRWTLCLALHAYLHSFYAW